MFFAKVKEFEDKIKLAEDDLINYNSDHKWSDLHSLNVEYIKYLNLEECILNKCLNFTGLSRVMQIPYIFMH